jgi:hypothetical protein
MPERVIYDLNLIYKVAELAMYPRVQQNIDCVAIGFPSTNPRPHPNNKIRVHQY